MRYFLKKDEGETGPFDKKALRASLREGLVADSALVRREGDPDNAWLPIRSELERAPTVKARGSDDLDDVDDFEERARWSKAQGNFGLGLLFGFFGGCIVLLIFLHRARPETKRGIYWGFAAQILVTVLLVMLRAK